jgi:hypothetical protein
MAWLRGKRLGGGWGGAVLIPRRTHRLVRGPSGEYSRCVARSDLGATTAPPADPILTVAKARLSRDPGATVARRTVIPL